MTNERGVILWTDATTAALGASVDEVWELFGVGTAERRDLERRGLLDKHQLAALSADCLALPRPLHDLVERAALHLYLYGAPEASARLYLRALALDCRREWHSTYLQVLYGSPDIDSAAILAAGRIYDRTHFSNHPTLREPLANSPDPDRRLRIAFLGYYFDFPISRTHLLPFLRALDPSRCEVLLYNDGQPLHEADAACGAWKVRETRGRDDRALAEMLRHDRVDVAVELVGHLPNNRFGALAFRPAPLQACYYNWQATTGLSCIDHVFADRTVVSSDEEPCYSETLLWPRHLHGGYLVPEGAPPVAPPPMLDRGCVTLGSFSSSHKLHDAVLGVWAKLLVRNPGWRLRLKNEAFAQRDYRRRIVTCFERAGVTRDRLTLEGRSGFLEMLDGYRHVDIALNSWPFSGGSTMLWALGQGVPTVTLRGTRHLSRAGAAILARLGLEDLVATDPEDYVGRVEALAADRARLCRLRARLRDDLQTAFPDRSTVAREWESAVRQGWRTWCARRTHGQPILTTAAS